MKRLFICRPEPGASASLSRARKLGLDAVAMPLFELHPLDWQPPDPAEFDALLVTSANALRLGGRGLDRFRHLPLVAVGEATAAEARRAGWTDVRAGSGGVTELLADLPGGLRLFHPRGRDAIEPGPVAQRLVGAIVYEAAELPPPPNLAELGGNVAAVHSPRAAARLAELVDAAGIDRGTIGLAAISSAAQQAAASGWRRSAAADRPTDEALLALAAVLCDEAGQQ